MYPPDVGVHAEDLVLQQWKKQVREQQAAALTPLAALGLEDSRTTSQIAVGSHWDEAMDDIAWEPTEVRVVGSSGAGRLARVFLGSAAIKIVRYSPVPVVYDSWAQALHNDEIAFIPPTKRAGETVGRFAFLHPHTSMDLVREILDRTK